MARWKEQSVNRELANRLSYAVSQTLTVEDQVALAATRRITASFVDMGDATTLQLYIDMEL